MEKRKNKIRYYIQSFRLRTLPLSVSGVILGTSLAFPMISKKIFVLNLLTAIFLQILSNLANELGDFYHGTDTTQKKRKAYALQEGSVSVSELKFLIIFFCCISALSGFFLIFFAFDSLWQKESLFFLALGFFAIMAALKYTLGKHAYGYHYGGDFFVFIFFGLICVCGTYFLQNKTITILVLKIAIAMGLMCISLLNLNNIRDLENDTLHKKHTIALLLGEKKAKIYQILMLSLAITIFVFCKFWSSLFFLPFFLLHFLLLWKNINLDKQMPYLSLLIFIHSLICGLEYIFFF